MPSQGRISKREKRIARAESKKGIYLKKNAKIIESAKKYPSKTPYIFPLNVSPCKIPSIATPESCGDKAMAWSLDKADREGTWSWGINRDWGQDIWNSNIEPFLRNCEHKLWKEIWQETYFSKKRGTKQKHVYYKLDQLNAKNKEAYSRLEALELDDCGDGKIFRFRVMGAVRLYGFTFGHIFGLVWYDPGHNIWPLDN